MDLMRTALAATTSGGAIALAGREGQFISKVKVGLLEVYRVTLTNEELEAAGIAETPDEMVFENVLRPLLIKKGVPDRYLYDGAPFKADETPAGLVLEFD